MSSPERALIAYPESAHEAFGLPCYARAGNLINELTETHSCDTPKQQ